jgi:Flp pilus assembly pilin Flp
LIATVVAVAIVAAVRAWALGLNTTSRSVRNLA